MGRIWNSSLAGHGHTGTSLAMICLVTVTTSVTACLGSSTVRSRGFWLPNLRRALGLSVRIVRRAKRVRRRAEARLARVTKVRWICSNGSAVVVCDGAEPFPAANSGNHVAHRRPCPPACLFI
jgi:hypothetical protein